MHCINRKRVAVVVGESGVIVFVVFVVVFVVAVVVL